MKVLVVNGEQDELRRTESLLDPLGPEVVSVSSGAEALRSIDREAPDLILLDADIADRDAFARCRSLETKGKARAIAVILATRSASRSAPSGASSPSSGATTNASTGRATRMPCGEPSFP